MPVDPTGTAPGLIQEPVEEPTISIRCKNGNCDSMQAVEVKLQPSSPRRLYQCVKCKQSFGVLVGGGIDI